MASISLPTVALVAAAGTAVTAGVSAYAAHQQGVAEANLDKQKARAAAIDEGQKQIDIRRNMLRAMASQNAGTLGAIGTGSGTSFGANTRRQLTEEQNDLLVSKANSSAQVSLFDSAASASRAAGNITGAADIFKAAPSVYEGVAAYVNG